MDKPTVLAKTEAGFTELLAALKGMDEAAMSRRFYGEWNVKDILSHIAGWQHEMAAGMERMARGERPTPEGTDYTDADGWNARFAAGMRSQHGDTVIASLRQGFATYMRAARAIPDDRFGEGKTVNRLLEASGYGHFEEHLPALKEYRASLAI